MTETIFDSVIDVADKIYRGLKVGESIVSNIQKMSETADTAKYLGYSAGLLQSQVYERILYFSETFPKEKPLASVLRTIDYLDEFYTQRIYEELNVSEPGIFECQKN